MIVIGVTGSVGMGKTEAAKRFLRNNIDVFECDKEIASFYNKKKTISEIKKTFPSSVFKDKVDKTALAKIVFGDKKKLKFLESLFQNKLRKTQAFWLRKKIREKKKILVFDVPLLFEKDNLRKYDIIIVLSCDIEIQRRRVLKRKGWTRDRLKKTLKEQMPDREKTTLGDIIIKTDRGKRDLNKNIIKIIKKARTRRNRRINDILKEF